MDTLSGGREPPRQGVLVSLHTRVLLQQSLIFALVTTVAKPVSFAHPPVTILTNTNGKKKKFSTPSAHNLSPSTPVHFAIPLQILLNCLKSPPCDITSNNVLPNTTESHQCISGPKFFSQCLPKEPDGARQLTTATQVHTPIYSISINLNKALPLVRLYKKR